MEPWADSGPGRESVDSARGAAAADERPAHAGWFPCTYVEWLPHEPEMPLTPNSPALAPG